MVGADDLGESCRRVLPSCLWPASQNTSHPSADRLAERFHGRAQRRTSLASRAPAVALASWERCGSSHDRVRLPPRNILWAAGVYGMNFERVLAGQR
jgi:hypothetical protein